MNKRDFPRKRKKLLEGNEAQWRGDPLVNCQKCYSKKIVKITFLLLYLLTRTYQKQFITNWNNFQHFSSCLRITTTHQYF